MIALIDNYDSFTFNVYDYLARQTEVVVFRNTDSLDRITPLNLAGIVISPGPSHPSTSLLSLQVLDYYKERLPILGICLGMQAMGYYFGKPVRRARTVMHGKVDNVRHTGGRLFHGVPTEFRAVRYHSLAVECDDRDLLVCAVSQGDGEAMAVQHESLPIFGLQFHPESYATPDGMRFITNFVEVCSQ